MTTRTIAYWATTGFLVLNLLSGAVAELAQRSENAEGMLLLGYPVYLMLIIGVWKILGTIAVLVPRFPRLKEWAYAGIFFNMTGAALSHAVVGDASGVSMLSPLAPHHRHVTRSTVSSSSCSSSTVRSPPTL